MKVARLIGLVFVAVFALSAMLASTASAIPKFKLPITNRGFTALSGTSLLTAPTANPTVVTCPHSTSVGTIVNDDEVDARVHFTGCHVTHAGKECEINSQNAASGLILTELLKGLLGLLHSPNGAAGILFEPANTEEKFVLLAAEPSCEVVLTSIFGSVAGLFSPTGKLQNTALITLALGTGKQQEVTLILTLAGTIHPELNAYGVAATEQTEDRVTFEEPVEVS